MRLLLASCLSVLTLIGCSAPSTTMLADLGAASGFSRTQSRFAIDGTLYLLSQYAAYPSLIGTLQGYTGRRPRLVGTIDGPSSGIDSPLAVATDSSGNVFVSNGFGDGSCQTCTITEYAAGHYGSGSPLATIGTDVGQEFGLTVDRSENVYAAGEISGPNNAANAVYQGVGGHYRRSRLLDRSNPGRGIALDKAGRIYLTTNGNGYKGDGALEVFAAGASGSSRPIGTITGSKTGMFVPYGVAIDASGCIYVAQFDRAAITVYPSGSVHGNVAPTRTITGPNTLLSQPDQLSIDARGDLFVDDHGNPNRVLVFAPGAAADATPIASYDAPPFQYAPWSMTVYPQAPPGS